MDEQVIEAIEDNNHDIFKLEQDIYELKGKIREMEVNGEAKIKKADYESHKQLLKKMQKEKEFLKILTRELQNSMW